MTRLMPAPSDGRVFTSYLSAGQREEALQRMAGVVNESQYRAYLQRNAVQVARRLESMVVLAPPAHRR
jgi:hypothetical protein